MLIRATPLLIVLAAPALADRLDPSVVDARARVLVHLDVQALKGTTISDECGILTDLVLRLATSARAAA